MVLKVLPIIRVVSKITKKKKNSKIIILSPRGKAFTTKDAEILKKEKDIILICGRYEGIDARVKKILKACEFSIGPYTLTGGELPAMVLMDAISRRVPGVIGKEKSIEEKRIAGKDVYTRPETIVYKKKRFTVPKVLLSGHHEKIDIFRKGRKRE
jgi:tRNA (guanine37-N1)-methyltransferase